MGYLRNRGTRQNPEWYIRFKDADGKWKQRHSKQTTKEKARDVLADAEERVKRGLQGIVEPTAAVLCRDLMATWIKTLINRSAEDDRSRMKRHLLPAFGSTPIDKVDLRAVMEWIDKQREAPTSPPPPATAATEPDKATEAEKKKKRGRGRLPKAGRLAEPTIRHNLNLLSRFFAWPSCGATRPSTRFA